MIMIVSAQNFVALSKGKWVRKTFGSRTKVLTARFYDDVWHVNVKIYHLVRSVCQWFYAGCLGSAIWREIDHVYHLLSFE
jgi:hypothetical protein